MLREILHFLHERRQASLRELAIHLDMEPATVEPMLATLERKGRIRTLNISNSTACRHCPHKCSPDHRADRLIYCCTDETTPAQSVDNGPPGSVSEE